ncbi:acyl-CoA synthetase [Enemella sp. A6]|uniref:acyl-CoA synthetase n=1 Tax=Enemella sp. A6 TaxID=3440152 RepID=UPI003EBCD29D
MTLNLANLYEAVAAAVPERIALVCRDEPRTFAELDQRANRVANYLISAGIKPGDHVGIHMLNSHAYVETLLGAFKARAVPININYRYTGAELSYLFNDADLKAVVVSGEFVGRDLEIIAETPQIKLFLVTADEHASAADLTAPEGVTIEDYEQAVGSADTTAPLVDERRSDDTLVIYTGGTTGMPKGVIWGHEAFYFACLTGANPYGDPYMNAEELVAGVTNPEAMQIVYSLTAPLMHGAALYTVWTALLAGHTTIMMPKYDPVEFLALVDKYKINICMIVGDAIARPLADALRDHGSEYDLSSLFYVGGGGAIFSETVQTELKEQLPNIILGNSFGASESGVDGTITLGEDGLMRLAPKPSVTVLDENLRPVEPGSGDLGYVARTGHIPMGYYGDEERTARTFPVIEGQRWVILGDMAEIEPDGTIIVHGRGSGVINTGGEKVFPEEVEQAIKAYPPVEDCLVAGVEDDTYGHRVGAVVQLREGAGEFTEEGLKAHLREHLAGYKLPAVVKVVDSIVRSPSGKADYRWAKRTLN